MLYFEIWKSNADEKWYWHLKEGGDIVCTGHPGYDRKSEAIVDIEMVKGTEGSTPTNDI